MNTNDNSEPKYLIVAALRFAVSQGRRASMLWLVETLTSLLEEENFYFRDILQAFAEYAGQERNRNADDEDKQMAWENIEVLLRQAFEQAEDL